MPQPTPPTLASISKLLDQKRDQKLKAQDQRTDQKFLAQEKHLNATMDQKLKLQRKEILDAIFKYTDKQFATKEELQELKEKISHLPTKDEFYTQMGKVMAELQTIRINQSVQTSQIANHSNRLETIETKLNIVTS